MKQTLLYVSIILLGSFSLASCGESADKWSPDKVLDRRDQRENRSVIKVNDDEVLEEKHEIEQAIRNAAPYIHVKKNKTASNNSFIYSLGVSGSIFPKKCAMTFYDDGYVNVESGDVNFTYSFDAQKAKELYTNVISYIEEVNTASLQADLDTEIESKLYASLYLCYEMNNSLGSQRKDYR